MSVVIPDDVLQAARMSEAELRLELAVMLFARDKVTLAQASRLSGLGRAEFQHLPGSRRITPYYGVTGLHEDVAALRDLGRL